MVEAILSFAILILSARFLEELMQRIKLSPIVGDVLAGLLVGPPILNLVQVSTEISFLINVGLFFFFFIIGFQEIDLFALRRTIRKRLFPAALIAFTVPLVTTYLFLTHFGASPQASILVSGLAGISSLGVVTRVMMDLKLLRNTVGLEVFGFVAIIEFIGLLFVTFLLQLTAFGVPSGPTYVLELVAKLIVFFIVVGVTSFLLAPPMVAFVRRHMRIKEASFGVIAGMVLIIVWFSEIMGIHGSIGALIFGLGLSKLADSPEHLEVIQGFRSFTHGIFIPIFFSGASLYFDFSSLGPSFDFVAGFVSIVLLSKFVGAIAGAKLARMERVFVLAAGGISKGGIELAFLITMYELNEITLELFSLSLLVIFSALIATPVVLRGATRNLRLGIPPNEIEESMVPLYTRFVYSTLKVKDIMSSTRPIVKVNMSIDKLLKEHLRLGYRNYIVIDGRGRLAGLVKVTDIGQVRPADYSTTQVKEIMKRGIGVLYPDTSVELAVEMLIREGVNRLPVVSPEKPREVIGTFDKGDVIKSILRSRREKPGKEAPVSN